MNLSVFTVRCTTCVNNNKTALPDKEIESEDEVVVQELTISPNPSQEWIDVALPPSPDDTKVTLSLFDVKGNLVQEVKTVGGSTQRIKTESYPPGVYILQANIGGIKTSHKVVLY
jgi:hypothetical protein